MMTRWKWRRWDHEINCEILDYDSFNLTGCAEFLTLHMSFKCLSWYEVCLRVHQRTYHLYLCFSFQTRLVSPHISMYPWSEQYKLKAANRNKMGSKVLDCTRWDWWIRCTNCLWEFSISGFWSAYEDLHQHDIRLWFCLQSWAWSRRCSSSSSASASSSPPANSCTLRKRARWELCSQVPRPTQVSWRIRQRAM